VGASWYGNENHRLTRHVGADPSGWDSTQLLRVPGTVNHKPDYGEPVQGLLYLPVHTKPYGWRAFDHLPELPAEGLGDWADDEAISEVDVGEVRARIKLPPGVRGKLLSPSVSGDVSDAMWHLEMSLAEAGCDEAEIVALMCDTAWTEAHYGGRGDKLYRLKAEAQKATGKVKQRASTPKPASKDDGWVYDEETGLWLLELAGVKPGRVRFLWKDYIPLDAATLLPGEEGIGKSTIGAWIKAGVTNGTLPGELYGQRRHVIILAPEDHISNVVVPRLTEAGADMDMITCLSAHVAGDGGQADVTLPDDMDKIATICRRRGTALIWVDGFVTTLPERVNSISYKDVATVIKQVGDAAEAIGGVALVAPWHFNKREGGDVALRMMDSRGFRTASRAVLAVVKDPTGGVAVALDKANGSSTEIPALQFAIGRAHYTVEEVDSRTGEVQVVPTTCGVADFVGEIPDSTPGREYVRALLKASGGGMSSDDDSNPKRWLWDFLTEREATSRDTAILREKIMAAAGEAAFSTRQIQRAAEWIRVSYRDQPKKREGSTPIKNTVWWLDPSHARMPPRTYAYEPNAHNRNDRNDREPSSETENG